MQSTRVSSRRYEEAAIVRDQIAVIRKKVAGSALMPMNRTAKPRRTPMIGRKVRRTLMDPCVGRKVPRPVLFSASPRSVLVAKCPAPQSASPLCLVAKCLAPQSASPGTFAQADLFVWSLALSLVPRPVLPPLPRRTFLFGRKAFLAPLLYFTLPGRLFRVQG